MSSISESLNMLADVIRSLNPYADSTVKIMEPKVGLSVGACINCRCQVKLRQTKSRALLSAGHDTCRGCKC